MTPVAKALWYIETHFAGEISLEEIATAAGVSRYHLSRTFGFAMGRSIMQYVRGRRLTEGGSVEGGLEELVEFLPSRSSRSAILCSRHWTSAETAAWTSADKVSQSA